MYIFLLQEHQPSAPILTNVVINEDTETASESEDDENITDIISYFKIASKKLPNTMSVTEKSSCLLKMYKLNDKHILKIEQNTRAQSESKEWFEQRKGRVTASLFGNVLRCQTGQSGIIKKIIGSAAPFINEAIFMGEKK